MPFLSSLVVNPRVMISLFLFALQVQPILFDDSFYLGGDPCVHLLTAQWALDSNLTGKWHIFPYTS
jgi:hypothetical protein